MVTVCGRSPGRVWSSDERFAAARRRLAERAAGRPWCGGDARGCGPGDDRRGARAWRVSRHRSRRGR